MKLTKTSEKLVRSLVNVATECQMQWDSVPKSTKNTLYKVITALLGDMRLAQEELARDKNYKQHLVGKRVHTVAEIPKPSSYNSSQFFPEIIRRDIESQSVFHFQRNHVFTLDGKHRSVLLNVVTTSPSLHKSRISSIMDKMLQWLYIGISHASPRCGQDLTVYYYDMEHKKTLPSSYADILSPIHINSAYAHVCAPAGEIVIYRQEEWFKVFVHETFHALGLDFATVNTAMFEKQLMSIYNLSIDYNPTEAYCEAWARIINVAFIAFQAVDYIDNEVEQLERFSESFIYMLEIERLQSVAQCNKVLGFMGLTYDMVVNGDKGHAMTSYKEGTSAFSYYVETAVLLGSFARFISHCEKYNLNLFDFRKTPSNMERYTKMYKRLAVSNDTKTLMKCVAKNHTPQRDPHGKSLRMSCFEIQ